jgi:hypothetical protein
MKAGRRRWAALVAAGGLVFVACGGGSATTEPSTAYTDVVPIDISMVKGPVSPLIRGFSGDADTAYLTDVGGTVDSWGGNPSSRFNYLIGHAWNSGADYEFRNGNYGQTGDAARSFLDEAVAAGAVVRLAVPTIGWIAKNDDNNTCSFPDGHGGCRSIKGRSCSSSKDIADPNLANVPSTPAMVAAWIRTLAQQYGDTLRFIAMDNEPELWATTHLDIHPECPRYEEILSTFIRYADAVHDADPQAALMGPVMCCWFDYWRNAPGPADGEKVDFLTWFLRGVRAHDTQVGHRTLDVVDVHYYPQSDVYNDKVDTRTAARRLRSTRSLWDPDYTDESWLDTKIRFIPRLEDLIAAAYPGTPLAISEWNFGADTTMNGALAIADVLGIYGREGVYMASYWRSPPARSPGYFAFKMYGNYDGRGSAFDGTALAAPSPDLERLSTFATISSDGGVLKVMLINKDPRRPATLRLDVGPFVAATGEVYRYDASAPDEIRPAALAIGSGNGVEVTLAAYSMAVVELRRG